MACRCHVTPRGSVANAKTRAGYHCKIHVSLFCATARCCRNPINRAFRQTIRHAAMEVAGRFVNSGLQKNKVLRFVLESLFATHPFGKIANFRRERDLFAHRSLHGGTRAGNTALYRVRSKLFMKRRWIKISCFTRGRPYRARPSLLQNVRYHFGGPLIAGILLRWLGRTLLAKKLCQMLRIEYKNGPIAFKREVISPGINQVCLPTHQCWRC